MFQWKLLHLLTVNFKEAHVRPLLVGPSLLKNTSLLKNELKNYRPIQTQKIHYNHPTGNIFPQYQRY